MHKSKQQACKPGGRAVAWLFVSLLLIMLTSCNPYVETPTITPTARPTSTRVLQLTPTIRQVPTLSPTCTVRTGLPAGTVNLRTGAGVSHGVVRVIREGEILTLAPHEAQRSAGEVIQRAVWLKVIDAKGRRGFIYGRYCK